MDDLHQIWLKAAVSASAFGMGKQHVPMPPEQGTGTRP
jgi:hypothetical protein